MIEEVLISYLNSLDLSAIVYMEQPKVKPEAFFVVEKTGGGVTNHINESTIAIQSYGKSLYQAASMNEEIKQAMSETVFLDEIASVQINSDYNYTDDNAKQYRYQAVFVITHY